MAEGGSTYEIILTATDKTREAFEKVKESNSSLREDLNLVAGAFAATAVASATAVAVLIKGAIDSADEMSKASQKIGMTTEQLGGLKYAAELSDVSFETLQNSLGKLAKNAFTAATQGGAAATAFTTLGVNVKGTDGHLKDSGTLLGELADKFSKMRNSSEKSALAVEIFGKTGRDMIPLLNGGSEGLEKIQRQAEKMGLTIGGDTARQAEEFNDSMKAFHKASEGLANSLMKDLIPNLTSTANAMADLSREGHPVLALFRGLAGLTQSPWDILFPTKDIGKSLDSINRIKELKGELSVIEDRVKRSDGAGLIFKWMYGTSQELQQNALIIKNQIAVMEKHGKELDAKPIKKQDDTLPNLDAERIKKELDALLKKSQSFADELVISHESAFDKIVTKYVAMDAELSKAGAAGNEQRKALYKAFKAFMVDEQDKRTAEIAANAQKEMEANSKIIEAQQEKFTRMAAQANEASATGDERENARYAEKLRELDVDRKVLEDKHLWDLKSEEKYQVAMAALKKEHQAKQLKSDIDMVNFGRSIKQGEYNSAMELAAKMTAGIAGHSRAAFEINKVASIATAIMNTYKGVSGVLAEFPGPAGWAMAAAQTAIGLVQVDMIQSTQFGGGAASAGGGGVPSLVGSPGIPVAPQPSTGGSTSSPDAMPTQQPVTVTIYNTGTFVDAQAFIDNTVIPQIKDAVSNKDVLIIDPRSRQAQVLSA